MNFCIILAGGKGKRLWPYSTEKEPKQFVDFFGTGKTQLQDTFQRMERIVGRDHILVCTNREYVSLVKNQLQGIDDSHIVIEPVGRNTAPSVALACMRIRKANPTINPNVVVVPSDQLIRDENAFADSIRRGFDFVSNHDRSLISASCLRGPNLVMAMCRWVTMVNVRMCIVYSRLQRNPSVSLPRCL